MKVLDTGFLDVESPGDRGVRFYLNADEPGIVKVEIDVEPPDGGTLRLRLASDDCLKLACRLYAIGKQARGDLPDNRARAN